MVCAFHTRYLCIVLFVVVRCLASPCVVLSGGLQPRKGGAVGGGEGRQRRNVRHHHQLGLRHQRSPLQSGRGSCFGACLGINYCQHELDVRRAPNPVDNSGGTRLRIGYETKDDHELFVRHLLRKHPLQSRGGKIRAVGVQPNDQPDHCLPRNIFLEAITPSPAHMTLLIGNR